MTVGAIVRTLEEWFPLALAESWDNVGLLLGDAAAPSRKLMACLTVTPASAAEAVRAGAGLVVSHHPILFRGTKKLLAGDPVWTLAAAGIAVHSPHTAFDGGRGGINEQWAAGLGLTDVKPLRPAATAGACKLVVFLPEGDLAAVQDAVFAAGGGSIGAYAECGFRSAGTGTFHGGAGTNPTVGQPGRREEAPELRWETIVRGGDVPRVVAALRSAHSYEEPAFDIVPLAPLPGTLGGGRHGALPQPLALAELAAAARKVCGAPCAEIVGPAEKTCRRVGIGCGAAADFLDDARRAQCDAFIVGEATFHQQLHAEASGIGLIVVGHYWSERFAVEALAARLQAAFPALECWASRAERPPAVAVSLA